MIRNSTLPARMSATSSFNDCVLVHRIRGDGLGVDDRPADVAQRLVDCMRQRVHGGRLMIAGDHHARAAMALQIFYDRVQELSCCSPLSVPPPAATPSSAANARAN